METIPVPEISCLTTTRPTSPGAGSTTVIVSPDNSAGDNPAALLSADTQHALFEYLCWLGDDRVILGTRLSQWCGHGPILEEDIALANIALDLIGQASSFLKLAALVEGKNRTEDSLAYLRGEREYRCVRIVEAPRGDYAFTIVRQLICSIFSQVLLTELTNSSFPELKARAQKALVEVRYHVEHARSWAVRLGDGTEESHQRMCVALQAIAKYIPELVQIFPNDRLLRNQGIVPDMDTIRPSFYRKLNEVLREATLPEVTPSEGTPMQSLPQHCGRLGYHTEHLGPLLCEMQVLPRTYPGTSW